MFILPWKVLFLLILFSGTLIAISAPSWMMAWMGLEINMLAILALLMENKSPRSAEATLKYFLVQALASAALISSVFLSNFSSSSFLSPLPSLLISLSLLLKLGAAPFHLWVPQVMEGLLWVDLFILLSWQKIAPFFLLSYSASSIPSSSWAMIAAILSAIAGAIGGLNQTSTRKILSFSSINHLSWMLFALLMSMSLWFLYFSVYTFMLFLLVLFLKKFNTSSLSSSFSKIPPLQQTSFFVSLFSFGGLPPLLGFAPKWLIISKIIHISWASTLILIFTSLITLYYYLRITLSNLLLKASPKLLLPLPSPSTSIILWSNLLGLLLTPIIFL